MQIGKNKHLFWILLSFLLSTLLNCNRYTYSIIYNQLDYILYLEVNTYFIPDEKQKEYAKQKLADLLEWNRESALPRYREVLVNMKKFAENGITEKNINYIYNTFKREIEIIAEKAAPDAAGFVLTLNNKQIENFRKEVISHRKEEENKYASESEDPIDRITQSTLRSLSRFYGSFSIKQKEKIKDYIKNTNYQQNYRWDYQDLMQNKFIELINKRADKETVSRLIKSWITWEDISLTGSYKKKFLAQRKFNSDLYIYVDQNIVTEKQRANAVNTIDDWIKIVDTLLNEK